MMKLSTENVGLILEGKEGALQYCPVGTKKSHYMEKKLHEGLLLRLHNSIYVQLSVLPMEKWVASWFLEGFVKAQPSGQLVLPVQSPPNRWKHGCCAVGKGCLLDCPLLQVSGSFLLNASCSKMSSAQDRPFTFGMKRQQTVKEEGELIK